MKISVARFLVATSGFWFAAAAFTRDGDKESLSQRDLTHELYCRCEASWENFYNHRLLAAAEDALSQTPHERKLYHHYDYTDAYIESGYYVIEGVTVLPRSECSPFSGRLLEEESPVSPILAAFEQDVMTVLPPESSSASAMFDAESSAKELPQSRDLTYYYGSKGKQIDPRKT